MRGPVWENQFILPYIQLNPTDPPANVKVVHSKEIVVHNKEINVAIVQNLINVLRLRTLTDTLKQRIVLEKVNLPVTNQVVE